MLFNQFYIAETLGMTLDELMTSMSVDEFNNWIAYFQVKNEKEDQAMKRAGN